MKDKTADIKFFQDKIMQTLKSDFDFSVFDCDDPSMFRFLAMKKIVGKEYHFYYTFNLNELQNNFIQNTLEDFLDNVKFECEQLIQKKMNEVTPVAKINPSLQARNW